MTDAAGACAFREHVVGVGAALATHGPGLALLGLLVLAERASCAASVALRHPSQARRHATAMYAGLRRHSPRPARLALDILVYTALVSVVVRVLLWKNSRARRHYQHSFAQRPHGNGGHGHGHGNGGGGGGAAVDMVRSTIVGCRLSKWEASDVPSLTCLFFGVPLLYSLQVKGPSSVRTC